MVHSTQNLLNKVDTVAQKTQTITQSIREAPNQLAEKTNAAIGKGIDLGKNLQTSVTEGASQLTQDPLAATQNLGKGLVDSTTSLGKDIGQGAQQLGGQVVSVAPAQSS